jgi:hypothetical protein
MALLWELLIVDTCKTNTYTEHIRENNSTIAIASMGVGIKSPHENGPYCFHIHGQIATHGK